MNGNGKEFQIWFDSMGFLVLPFFLLPIFYGEYIVYQSQKHTGPGPSLWIANANAKQKRKLKKAKFHLKGNKMVAEMTMKWVNRRLKQKNQWTDDIWIQTYSRTNWRWTHEWR